jgi:hypothetical protein
VVGGGRGDGEARSSAKLLVPPPPLPSPHPSFATSHAPFPKSESFKDFLKSIKGLFKSIVRKRRRRCSRVRIIFAHLRGHTWDRKILRRSLKQIVFFRKLNASPNSLGYCMIIFMKCAFNRATLFLTNRFSLRIRLDQ